MDNKVNWRLVLIICILCLGTFLRFYKIDDIPPGIIQDEAAIGYNSYSILMTGKDEYSQTLPLVFRSFADYKLPLYLYMTTVPVKFFGLNIFSLRFASAFAGSMTILLVYLLSREIFGYRRLVLATTNMLIFALSPWSILFSRGAHEVNVGLFLFLLAILVQLIGIRRNNHKLIIISAVFYALTTFTYITFKFLSFVVFFLTFVIYRKLTKETILVILVFVVIASPQYYLMKYAAGNNRISSLFDSQRIVPRYLSYYSPRNLFFDPDPDGNKSIPDLSTFYPWMVIPYLWGLIALTRSPLLLVLFLLSPIPASIAKDPFSNVRSLPLLVPITLIVGLGIERIKSYFNRSVFLIGCILLFGLSLVFLYRGYFVLLPHERYSDWVYGFRQMVEIIEREYPDTQVLLNDTRGVYYSELLFFTKYSPLQYQTESSANPLKNYYNNLVFEPRHKFGKFETRPIDWGPDRDKDQIIISDPIGINPDQAEEHHLEEIFSIYGADQELVYNVYKTHPYGKN